MSQANGGAKADRARWNLVVAILAIAFASTFYRILVWKKLEQTSLLFIGIPTVLAVLIALTPKTKTVTGGILKGLTVALLVSGTLLGEGFVCILMAVPIFYLVAIIIGLVIDASKRANKQTTTMCLLLAFLLPMSFEGTSERFSFRREEAVSAERIVGAPANQVERALARSPRVGLRLPFYLRLGFPRPMEAKGSGLRVGDRRQIHFAGGEGRPGDLLMEVAESRPGYVRFLAVSDGSKVAHWLTWREAEVAWKAVDASHTRVSWTLRFRRELDPAWYFRPWERYAARLAAEHLIETNATPTPSEMD